jgi:hypothetical protein
MPGPLHPADPDNPRGVGFIPWRQNGERAMNKLIVAFLAGVFAFGSTSVCGPDEKQLQGFERVCAK